MKNFLICIAALFYSLAINAQKQAPIVPKFGVAGAKWYYENKGKSNDQVKHIYIFRTGDSIVQAKNYITGKFEDHLVNVLIFNYLDEDSVAIDYDTLLVKSDTTKISYFDKTYKFFSYLYWGLHGNDGSVKSVNPFAANNKDYEYAQFNYQHLTKSTCVTINDNVLGYYKLGNFNYCHFYPLGDNIIERIGASYYMLRFDSCRTDLYGGPLLWYYDPELGLYEPGKTKIVFCEDTISNSINENKAINAVKIYPLPFTQSLNIDVNNTGSKEIFIYTVAGKLLYYDKMSAGKTSTLNTSQWPAGIYILKQRNFTASSTQKIIKQ